jgi:hypothetical protein
MRPVRSARLIRMQQRERTGPPHSRSKPGWPVIRNPPFGSATRLDAILHYAIRIAEMSDGRQTIRMTSGFPAVG